MMVVPTHPVAVRDGQNNTAEEFAWLGRLLVPFIVDGRHSFTFKQGAAPDTTEFVHSEAFSGILVFLLKFGGATDKGFKAFNQELKKQAEYTFSGN